MRRTRCFIFTFATLAVSASGIAQAQTTAPTTMGLPIPGLCLFARDVALGTTKAGVAANARMRQLSQQIQAEFAPEQQAIATEESVLRTSAAQMTSADRQRRTDALQKRATSFAGLQRVRSAQLQQTRGLAIAAILKPMDAALTPIATSRHCSVVVERSATYGFNAAMDLTPAVIQQVDARLPTLTFDLAPPANPAPR